MMLSLFIPIYCCLGWRWVYADKNLVYLLYWRKTHLRFLLILFESRLSRALLILCFYTASYIHTLYSRIHSCVPQLFTHHDHIANFLVFSVFFNSFVSPLQLFIGRPFFNFPANCLIFFPLYSLSHLGISFPLLVLLLRIYFVCPLTH